MNFPINGHLIGEEMERALSRKTFRLSKMSMLSPKLGPPFHYGQGRENLGGRGLLVGYVITGPRCNMIYMESKEKE